MPGAVSRPLSAALAQLRFGPVDLDEFDRGIRRLRAIACADGRSAPESPLRARITSRFARIG